MNIKCCVCKNTKPIDEITFYQTKPYQSYLEQKGEYLTDFVN